MAALSVETTALTTGLAPTFNAADVAGDTFSNNGRTFLYVKNGDASPMTVTVDSQVDCNQGFDHNVEITVPATGEAMFGPFNVSRFKNSEGVVDVTYSSVTSVTIAVVALGLA